jgi:catechol 2,3-dioxygenase
MPARVAGLGHVGIYVRDLDRMKDFYANFMGMTLTKTGDAMAFFSADPSRSDHEIALMKGRTLEEDPHLINQISLRVATLDDLRDFYRRVKADGHKIESLVCHASAIGLYFRDPEDNITEVFWVTGLPSWVGIGAPIDIERPDEVVWADVHRVWDQVKHVPMGTKPDDATAAVARNLSSRAGVGAD